MIDHINDSKKAVIIWTVVFLTIFIGLSVFFITTYPEAELWTIVLFYIPSCLPIGWAMRRKLIKWYAHVPTEKILVKVNEGNLLVAIWRLLVVLVLAELNICLFIIYTVGALVVGPFVNLYAIISGFVFMFQKKI